MPLYQQMWWKKLFGKKEAHSKVDIRKDLGAVLEEVQDLKDEVKPLIKLLQKLEELEKEYEVGNEDIRLVNLETQADIIDQILQRYEFIQDDIDINGIRLRYIGKEFLHRAQRAGLKDLVEEKKQDRKWRFE